MLTEQEEQQTAEMKQVLRALEGITPAHAYELECSLDILLRAVDQTPEERATWTHFTLVVDKEMFENAGYDVSEITALTYLAQQTTVSVFSFSFSFLPCAFVRV